MLESLVAAGVGMTLCATEIRQDANQLYRVGNAVVEKTLEFNPASNGEKKALLQVAVQDVLGKSESVRDKVARLKASIMDADDISDVDIDRMTNAFSGAASMFNGMLAFLQDELESSDVQDEEVRVLDRQIMQSVVFVRNDIENLLSLLKQMKVDSPLDAEALFANREEAMDVVAKGMYELGYSESDIKEMIH